MFLYDLFYFYFHTSGIFNLIINPLLCATMLYERNLISALLLFDFCVVRLNGNAMRSKYHSLNVFCPLRILVSSN